MAAVGNLLFDSISPNTGDIAIGLASNQVLSGMGFETRTLNPFCPTNASPLIIGGGELIRTAGDPFYDSYRRRGAHVLNAVGVWSSADDLDYLKEYAFVSARSEREADTLRKWVPDAQVVPCATTLLTSERYSIPGNDEGEPLVGIHVVPHALRLMENLVQIINDIPGRKVFIPFTHYNGDASFMNALPFDRTNSITLDRLTPLELHSVIGQMSYVIVSSLHASIFAYSQNVPFASIYQKKAHHYFQDRGLSEYIVRDETQLRAAIDRFNSGTKLDFSASVEADRSRVVETFAHYGHLLRAGTPGHSESSGTAASSQRREDEILLAQAQHVIRDRDLAISYSESRRLQARADEKKLRDDLQEVRQQLESMRKLLRFRVPRVLGRACRTTLRALSTMFKRT